MFKFTRVPHAPVQGTFVVDVRDPEEESPRYLMAQDLNTAQLDYFSYTRKFGKDKEGGLVYNHGGRAIAYISQDGELWAVDSRGRPTRAVRTLRQAYNATSLIDPSANIRDQSVQHARSRFDVGDLDRSNIDFDTEGVPDRQSIVQLRRQFRSLEDDPVALQQWKQSIADANDREFAKSRRERMTRMAALDPAELASDLRQFTGGGGYTRTGFPPVLITAGVRYLCEAASSWWLVDVIASHQTSRKVRPEEFQVWNLTVGRSGGASIVADDGNGNKIATQRIPYTDFPLPKIKLYCVRNPGETPVVMLPGEY